ncbi:mycoredoxin [Corynebacterium kozikiae]|uniref:mycoredoxin n=1 Tax=Corynebacterium kozikiae TaxID=2968469 RepID=UPI00211B9959|nr:mycoredoxin [Corynebacterium sp. 76QC2CO]MCQ9344179.1 mycoredoxin [Corynebacterium sp. 76QC2CO]
MSNMTVFYADWCPFCRNLLRGLRGANIPFELVDVDRDAEASEWVKSVNGGNRVVPTVRYADNTTATNPSLAQVQEKLAQLS